MKQLYFKLSGCLFFLLFVSLHYEIKGQTVIIDGDLSNWNTIPYLHTNAGKGSILTAIKAIAGENDIFFYIEETETRTFSQSDLYIDTDNNYRYTPADYPAGAGAELLIQILNCC